MAKGENLSTYYVQVVALNHESIYHTYLTNLALSSDVNNIPEKIISLGLFRLISDPCLGSAVRGLSAVINKILNNYNVSI